CTATLLFFSTIRTTPIPTLFPYTTLFRSPRTTPDTDKKIHRQQHHFPEDVEQEEIESQEDPDHARFQQEEQNAISLHVFGNRPRSEEHTSELQSRGHLVCRLLLEKKKK